MILRSLMTLSVLVSAATVHACPNLAGIYTLTGANCQILNPTGMASPATWAGDFADMAPTQFKTAQPTTKASYLVENTPITVKQSGCSQLQLQYFASDFYVPGTYSAPAMALWAQMKDTGLSLEQESVAVAHGGAAGGHTGKRTTNIRFAKTASGDLAVSYTQKIVWTKLGLPIATASYTRNCVYPKK